MSYVNLRAHVEGIDQLPTEHFWDKNKITKRQILLWYRDYNHLLSVIVFFLLFEGFLLESII